MTHRRSAALSLLLGCSLVCLFVAACAERRTSGPIGPARPGSVPSATTRATTRATTAPTTRPTTGPTTAPTTGPTEQSAAGVEAPPAPPLSPEEALKTFKIAPGFRIELVAAEPLVQDPVVLAFDADGRTWVAEMTSYMPDSYGKGEKEPTGRIVILTDTDADGRLDHRHVWLDGLVLPRAVLPIRDGALVGEPPNLWFWRDTDHDGKADKKQLVASDYGNPKMNPEHQANGLLLAMDNWVYSANYNGRFRWTPDDEAVARGDKHAVKWLSSRLPARGQWGLSMDDAGRLYHNSNSDYLRADLVPPHYFPGRNPNHPSAEGVNWRLDKDQAVWPIRPTPAVNRGYRKGFLRDDGSLKEFTAACGPCVYRGGLFPEAFKGDVFVCEPSAHLVRRAKVTEDGAVLTATNAYDKAEFLASTDERFRPVNLHVAPDGSLYVVDMYRGILQHVYYLTGYLRELHLRRDMELPIHMGRIYRIVPEDRRLRPAPKMAGMASAELVELLEHENGWVRDTAQRLIIERGSPSGTVLMNLKTLAGHDYHAGPKFDERPILHALWTLEGLRHLDDSTLKKAMNSHARVAAAAVRLSDRYLAGQPPERAPGEVVARVLWLARNSRDPHVRIQCAASLSDVDHRAAAAAVADLIADAPDDKMLRDAALSGLRGRELPMLERLLRHEQFAAKGAGRDATLAAFAAAVLRDGKPESVARALDLAAAQFGTNDWRGVAILSGLADVARKEKSNARAKAVRFDAPPPALAALADGNDPRVAELLTTIDPLLHWPNKPGEKQDTAPPLSADHQKLFDDGKILFAATCAACHQSGGEGLEGKAPPLRGSPWILGPEGRLVRIVLNGVRGPIHVGDQVINMEMPNLAALDDRQIAAVLTYARREWGHAGEPVDPDTVKAIRAQVAGRPDAWTEEELLEVK